MGIFSKYFNWNYGGKEKSVSDEISKNKELEKFKSYEDNTIKWSIINHYIDKDIDKHMSIHDVKFIESMIAASKKNGIIDMLSRIESIVLAKELAINTGEIIDKTEVKAVYCLNYDKMYNSVFIDYENEKYMRLVTSKNRSVYDESTGYGPMDDIYFMVLRLKGSDEVYGVVVREKNNKLIIHPTIYTIVDDTSDIINNTITFKAVDSLSVAETTKAIYSTIPEKKANKYLENIDSYKVYKTYSYNAGNLWWYKEIPITISLKEKKANG